MAKKKKSVSINALEKYCKNTTPETYELVFQAGDDGEQVTYTVKHRLSLEECLRFVEDVVSECVRPDDLMVIPLAKSFLIERNMLTYYANFTMPVDMNKAFELVCGASEIISAVRSHIDNKQLCMIVSAIDDRIEFEEKKMISLQEAKVDHAVTEVNQFINHMAALFDGVDGQKMANFISNMSNLSGENFGAKELAEAIVGHKE